jgi:hypothetical protein
MMMTLSELAERLKNVRTQKKALAAELKIIEDEEGVLMRDLLGMLHDNGLDRTDVAGLKLARVKEEVASPDPEHWLDIFQWAISSGNWHMLRKQLNITSVRELVQSGEVIPFVTVEEIEKLKVTDLRAA